MSDYQNVLVVIPSLDPDDKLLAVIRGVQEKGFTDILLVDDGSSEDKQHFFDEGAALGCHVLHHGVNKGKGRALKTAFEWFMENRKQSAGVVTIDGDNQHLPKDIAACVDVMFQQEKDSLILGVRDFNLPHVPPKSRFGNKLTSSVFRLFCGLKVSDTQTGLRVFPRGIIQKMIEISGERFEYETNMLLECKQADISIVEQTIETVYINDNETTHFHPIKDSLRVYGIIIKFFISSLLSFVIDQILNVLGYNVLFKLFAEGARQFCAGTLARILSSLFNFTMNRKAVFRSDAPLRITICRYYVLWVCQLLASVGSVFLLSKLLPVKPTIIKPFVDFLLYFISFRVQQAWVFKPASSKDAGADESTNA